MGIQIKSLNTNLLDEVKDINKKNDNYVTVIVYLDRKLPNFLHNVFKLINNNDEYLFEINQLVINNDETLDNINSYKFNILKKEIDQNNLTQSKFENLLAKQNVEKLIFIKNNYLIKVNEILNTDEYKIIQEKIFEIKELQPSFVEKNKIPKENDFYYSDKIIYEDENNQLITKKTDIENIINMNFNYLTMDETNQITYNYMPTFLINYNIYQYLNQMSLNDSYLVNIINTTYCLTNDEINKNLDYLDV